MQLGTRSVAVGLVLAVAALGALALAAQAPAPRPSAVQFGRLPLTFVPAADGHGYAAQGPGYALTLTSPEAALHFAGGNQFRLKLRGAKDSTPHGAKKLASYTNDYTGADQKKWRIHVPNFAEVDFASVYPGISLRYYGTAGQLEADFLLAADANASRIELEFPGAGKPKLEKEGAVAIGPVRLGRPDAYQIVAGQRRAVRARYQLHGGRADIALGAYDRSLPLVIDPTLSYSYSAPGGYSTFLGLRRVFGLNLGPDNNPILIGDTGLTASGLNSCTSPSQPTDYCNITIWKFNPAGTALLWQSNLVAANPMQGFAYGSDPLGDTLVAGTTNASVGFPTTPGVIQPTPSGAGMRDFLARFDPNGNLLYATLLGSGGYQINAVTGDGSGNAYVAGEANLGDGDVPPINSLPEPCVALSSCETGFVEGINTTGSNYIYGTYYGGNPPAPAKIYTLTVGSIAVDQQGHVYIGGSYLGPPALPAVNSFESICTETANSAGSACETGFIAGIDPTVGGTAGLLFSDYLAGGFTAALLADSQTPANLYVAGLGGSASDPAFPNAPSLGVTNNAYLLKIPTATPAAPAFYTVFDGGRATWVQAQVATMGLGLDPSGDIWTSGSSPANSPFALWNPISLTCPSGTTVNPACATGYVNEISPDGSALLFSTYLGGSFSPTPPNLADTVQAVVSDASGNIYAGGTTSSADFPVTPGAFNSTCCGAFLAKLTPQAAPTVPAVSINPGSLPVIPFVGVAYATQIIVTNTATAGPNLVITSVVATDPDGNYTVYPQYPNGGTFPTCFQYGTSNPSPVPPGGSCQIAVNWRPEFTTVPDPLTVTIYDNAANSTIPQAVNYNPTAVNGSQAQVTVSGSLGSVLQGNTNTVTVTLTNDGNQNMVVQGYGLTGASDFSLATASSQPCGTPPFNLNVNNSCNVAVVYTANGPLNTAETATLTFTDTSITPPGTSQSVPLTATTVPPEPKVVANPSFLNFGTIAEKLPSATGLLIVENEGSAPLTIFSAIPTGPNAGDFQVTNGCTSAVAVFNSCQLSVVFTPTTTGPESAVLNVASSDPNTPTAINLSGTGAPAPGPPTDLPFIVSSGNTAPPASAGAFQASAASNDGQFVAFTDTNPFGAPASNLPGPVLDLSLASGINTLFVRNTCNGPNAAPGCTQTTQFIGYGPAIGLDSNGGAACVNGISGESQGATNVAISADGRFVAFNDDACASGGIAGAEPGPVFLRDLLAAGGTGSTVAVTDANGNDINSNFVMSRDARYFAYGSNAGAAGAPALYATDTAAPDTVTVSQSTFGTLDAGTSLSLPAISPDGRYVAFASIFDDIHGIAGNGFSQVYLRDTCFGTATGTCTPSTILVSADASASFGTGGNSGSDFNLGGQVFHGIAVAAGGRYVVFTSNATNLPQPPLSGGGTPVEVYLRDTQLGVTTLISAAAGGTAPTGNSVNPQISADGRVITFINQGQLLGTAPANALYSYDTCTSNGVAVTGCNNPKLQGAISADNFGTERTFNDFVSLDPTGQFATYTGPPNSCSGCGPIWENSTGVTVAVTAPPPTIATISLPPATAGQPYPATAIATSGGAPPVSVNLASGSSLPPGLSLSANTISGTPTAAGNVTFDVFAQDSASAVSANQPLTIDVGCPVISIAPTSPIPQPLLAVAGLGLILPNFAAVLPSGNTLAVTLNATGNLDGLIFDSATGVLSGTPLATGTFSIMIGAAGGGCQATSPATITLAVTASLPVQLPVIQESIHVSDNPLGLMSALVLPVVPERISVSDAPSVPPPCAVAAAGLTTSLGGFVRIFGSTNYSQRVTITNNGSTAISGPVYLVLDSLQNATLPGAAGTTSCAAPLGNPYVVALPAVQTPLAAGASVSITLKFSDPQNKGITYSARLLVGGKP